MNYIALLPKGGGELDLCILLSFGIDIFFLFSKNIIYKAFLINMAATNNYKFITIEKCDIFYILFYFVVSDTSRNSKIISVEK